MKRTTQQTMTAAQWRKEMGLEVRPAKKAAPKKAGRFTPNSNELRYRDMHLAAYRTTHEAKTFHLAERCTYTPDWEAVGYAIEYHEVKHDKAMLSGKQEDSRVKFKVASAMNPEFIFVWAKWITKEKAYKREFWKAGRKLK